MAILRDYIKIRSKANQTKKFKWTSITDNFSKRLDIKQINYVNTPLIQYFGEAVRTFNITIVLGTVLPFPKKSYKRDKEWLTEFFNTDQSKLFTLTFPDGKPIRCVLNSGNFNENSGESGKISVSFQCTYYPEPKEEPTGPNITAALLKAQEAYNKLEEASESLVNTVEGGFDVVTDYIEIVSGGVSTLEQIATDIIGLAQQPSEWVSALLEINRGIRALASTPQVLYANVIGLISQVGVYFEDTSSTFDAVLKTFNFETLDIKTSTNVQDLRIQNNKAGNNVIFNSMSFISMMNIATSIDYLNSEEVDRVQNSIDATYRSLISDPPLGNDLRQALLDAKLEVDSFLNSIRLRVNSVITENIRTVQPFDQIVFNRYGNLDFYTELVLLNSQTITNINNVSGEVKLYAV